MHTNHKTIGLSVVVGLILVTNNLFAVEPTTFPTNKITKNQPKKKVSTATPKKFDDPLFKKQELKKPAPTPKKFDDPLFKK